MGSCHVWSNGVYEWTSCLFTNRSSLAPKAYARQVLSGSITLVAGPQQNRSFQMAAIQLEEEFHGDRDRSKGGRGPIMGMKKLAQKYPLPRFKRVRVTLQSRVFNLYDASFRRPYLTHKRTKESPEARYHIGDLVWVKKRDRPWWPAMVSVHPQRNYYLKYISDTEIAYHVQLFGPETDHHWVVKTFCKTFKGFDKFEKSMHKDISTSPTIKRAAVWRSYAVASSSQGQQLNEAISEAEKALKLEPLERLRRLTYWYYSTRYEKFFM